MSSENLHEPYEKLSTKTLDLHRAIASLMEELEAVDWYQQRVDNTDDPELKKILLHNRNEEVEHAAMVMEWLRRNDEVFEEEMETYLFTEAPILEVEENVTSGQQSSEITGNDTADLLIGKPGIQDK